MQTRFLVITGMSGAGKTQVVRALEDLKYFCIDNLPAALIPKFAELCRQTSEKNVALVVDVRGGQFFDKLLQVLDEIKASGQKYELLFLDADDAVLVKRYKEVVLYDENMKVVDKYGGLFIDAAFEYAL